MILYKTVRKEAQAEQVIERSKFIAHVKPVETKDEADAFIKEIKEQYKDATHNVPAMVIGDKQQIQWASDDGEPQGTSGAPMVQMMVSKGITNTVIVVTRYFGGVKLGTGGLVRAYTGSAQLGLEAAEICEVKEMATILMKMEYTYLQKIQNAAKTEKFSLGEIKYEEKITAEFLTEPENVANIIEHVTGITNGTVQVLGQSVAEVLTP